MTDGHILRRSFLKGVSALALASAAHISIAGEAQGAEAGFPLFRKKGSFHGAYD